MKSGLVAQTDADQRHETSGHGHRGDPRLEPVSPAYEESHRTDGDRDQPADAGRQNRVPADLAQAENDGQLAGVDVRVRPDQRES
ncbi:hypothetical protein [Fodinicola feengrottensis]|uniref:hypothetical protein n=1 Tax=Fodinicola feengrottensis TaxID=435914 RepID=UPI0024417E92|nr:hypothetical protein [Fodinicola feengrottensis]